MPSPRHFKALHTHRHGRRRWVVLCLLLIALALGGVGYYATRPARLAAFASSVFEAMYRGAEAHIDSAHFTWGGTIELRGLKLRVPTLPGEAGDLFEAEQAVLRIDPWSVLTGSVELKQVIVVRPVLSLTEVSPERFNFDVLRELQESKPSDGKFPPLPRVVLREGTVRYGEIVEGRYIGAGPLRLAGRLDPDPQVASRYRFELYEPNPDGTKAKAGADLRGRFDLERFQVQAELSDFALANAHRNMLPRQVRRLWDQFEPTGAISGVKFHYDEGGGPHAEVRVDDVAITIPQLASGGYKARVTGVSGTFRFDEDRVNIEGLVGEVEGLRYAIDGEIRGYNADAPFTLQLRTQPFRVPEEPRYMPALPSDVQKIFQMLTPVGWMSVSVTARRDTPGGELDYSGQANILSGRELIAALREGGSREPLDPADPKLVSRGKYFKFPYEVSNVHGLITFNSQGVTVRNLTGDTAGGGSLTITGTLAPPNSEAVVDLTIAAVDIPFDQTLYDAMKDKHREATRMFFDEAAWQRLHDAGHFIGSAERAALVERRVAVARMISEGEGDALAAEFKELEAKLALPVFDLGGLCNAVVKVYGGTGEGVSPDVDLALDLTRANVVFKHFPYPLRVARGRLLLTGKQGEFENVRAVGLRGGGGGLVGKFDLPDTQKGTKLVPRLGLHADGFPLDGLMFDVLGEPHGDWLRGLRLTGAMKIDGTILRDPEADRIDIDMAVLLSGGSIAPGSGAYKLDDLNGRLTLSLKRVQIEGMTASHGGSTIDLSGEAGWSDREAPVLRLHAEAKAMRFEDPVLELVRFAKKEAGPVDRFWAERKPAGLFDAVADYTSEGEEKEFGVALSPRSLAFGHNGQRIELADTRGRIVLDADRVLVEGFSGSYDSGRLGLDGSYTFEAPRTGEFALTAAGSEPTATMLALLPPRVAGLVTALQFDGGYALDLPTLRLHPDASPGEPSTEIAGTLRLADAAAHIGVGIAGLNGEMALSASTGVGSDSLKLNVDLRTESLRVADRPVTALSMRLYNLQGSDTLRVADLRGECAEGLIGGEGVLSLSSGDYEMRLALANARLDQLSVKPKGEPGADPEGLAGLLSASLDIEGSWKDPTRLRGRGSIAVRNGGLRSVPLASGLLGVSHLRVPVASAFDNATVSYYMLHDRVVFESIEMASRSIRLSGKGEMELPGRELDITLTTGNPDGLRLGPLSQLLDKVRNQLVTLRVGGTLERPETRVQQLNGLSEAWEDVFGPRAGGADVEKEK